MTRVGRLGAGVIGVALLVAAALQVLSRPAGAARTGRVYSVAQFVQPGTGPLWTTNHATLFLIHGILRRASMQPVADFILSDNGSRSTASGGLALAAGPPDAMIDPLLRVAILRAWLPHTPDNPLLGVPAIYRVTWTGCPQYGCSHSPWQLASGGSASRR